VDLQQFGEQLLADIECKIKSLIGTDLDMRKKQLQLQIITRFGPQVSAPLTALLSWIAFAHTAGFIAYSTLDPRPYQSTPSRLQSRRCFLLRTIGLA